jgi:photosystem II stability/assembly factor-like uncharacterized protein
MKRARLLIGLVIISVVGVVVLVHFLERAPSTSPTTRAIQSAASEGTGEDPLARRRYDWLRLRDPAANEIPRDIGTRELEFVKSLASHTKPERLTTSREWVARGPYNIGGRTKALALDITDENVILAGCVSSGMWKSTDGGSSWTKTTAPGQLHSVSCISQNKAPGREHIWYYGTGEWMSGIGGSAAGPLGTGASYRGDGIFKSTDNGNTWSLLPSTVSGTPTLTDPFDFIWKLETFGEDGIYAATSSGLFRSDNGGNTWDHVLDFGADYPSTEIALTSQETCYATISGDGPVNGIYRCVDGETWENISPPDWPDTTVRTVIAIAPSNEGVVYFLADVAHWRQQLRKYEEGVGWTDLTAGLPYNGEMTTYGGNMLILYVKPDDENTLFLGTVGLYRSVDGGQSFEVIGAFSDFHVDQHSIVFYPSDPGAMIVGNDGGIFKTTDNVAETVLDPTTGEYRIEWESLNNGYVTTQFYTVAIDHGTPNSETVLGGTQDNAWPYTMSSDPEAPWASIFGGAADGGFTGISDGGEYFYTGQAATFTVWRHSFPGGEHRWTDVTPASAPGLGLWLTPIILDPHDTRIMYLGSRTTLWRNSDLTEIPWVFPPEPTDVNWSQLENVEDHQISALGMSKAEPRRLYYGTNYGQGIFWGNVFYLDNPHEGQPVPVEVTGDNFPFYPYCPYVHCIAVDPEDVDKVVVVFPNYGVISIYASEDGGATWAAVGGNLEENPDGTGSGPSVRWVSILHVDDKPIYFAGTSVGLFSTTKLDGMNTVWVQEGVSTIGNVVVDMIDVRQTDGFVAVGTHGNGVYSTYVTELPSGVEEGVSHPRTFELFPAYPNPFKMTTTVRFALTNEGLVRLRVYNILGEEVATLINGHRQAGEHHVQWMADGVASGAYSVRLDFEGFSESEKVVLHK